MTCFFISLAVLERHTPHAEMTTDQDLPMDGQSTTALFTAKGIDVTPNKDQGVIKVLCCQTFKCVFCANLKAYCTTWRSIKMEACLHRSWSVQDMLETSQWLETKWVSITLEGCWTGRSLTLLKIARSLLASVSAKVNPSGIIVALCEDHAIVSCSGQVLKAWDVGVSSMKRGEVSIFLCAPEYAYGVAGNPDKIPPNSAVVFEVGAPGQQFWWRISFSVTQFFCFNPLHSVYSLSVHKNQWYLTTYTLQKIAKE